MPKKDSLKEGEKMSIHAVLYSQPHCMKCKQTFRILSKSIPVQVEKLFAPDLNNEEWSNKKIEEFKERGYRSMPAVSILDENGTCLDEWCDFQFDKIQKWTKVKAS